MWHCGINVSVVCVEKTYKLGFTLCFSTHESTFIKPNCTNRLGRMGQRGESWALKNVGFLDQAVCVSNSV